MTCRGNGLPLPGPAGPILVVQRWTTVQGVAMTDGKQGTKALARCIERLAHRPIYEQEITYEKY